MIKNIDRSCPAVNLFISVDLVVHSLSRITTNTQTNKNSNSESYDERFSSAQCEDYYGER